MSNFAQNTYDSAPGTGYAGQLADSGRHDVKTVLAAVAIAAGLLVVRGATPELGYLPTTPDAASATAFVTAGASAATVQTVSGASLDGAVGQGQMNPPRNVVLVLSSHADWDLTVATVTGLDAEGNVLTEDFHVPNAGNVTLTGAKLFSKVTSLYVPAQSGTGGTYTMGTGLLLGALTGGGYHGVALYDATHTPDPYAISTPVPCVHRGRIRVVSETSYTDGGSVYVRFAVSGSQVAGQFRASPDGNTCALVKGARFWRSGSAGVAVIELNPS